MIKNPGRGVLLSIILKSPQITVACRAIDQGSWPLVGNTLCYMLSSAEAAGEARENPLVSESKPHKRLPCVIVPVFNAFEVLGPCLAALDRCSADASVYLVDDASDDDRVLPLLRDWAACRPNASVIELSKNRGFVHAANRGALASQGDIVLLNSDTVVTSGWLEALGRCLASDSRIATATPWSNNAEIVSLPEFCVNNPPPESPEAWSQAVRSQARGHYPELPTAVGFCMAVSRTAINELGLFDEATFGRGYGEENDFCRRAATAGWRNVLCEDAFVVHMGGKSFAPLGLKPGEETMSRLLQKHPDYAGLVAEWIERDPLAEQRNAIVMAFQSGKIEAPGSGTET